MLAVEQLSVMTMRLQPILVGVFPYDNGRNAGFWLSTKNISIVTRDILKVPSLH